MNAGVPASLSGHGNKLKKDIAQLTRLVAALQPVRRESSVAARPQAA